MPIQKKNVSLFVLHMPGGSLPPSRSQRCSQGFFSLSGNQKAYPLQSMGLFQPPAGNCQSGRVWGVIIPSALFGLSAALFCSVCCGLWNNQDGWFWLIGLTETDYCSNNSQLQLRSSLAYGPHLMWKEGERTKSVYNFTDCFMLYNDWSFLPSIWFGKYYQEARRGVGNLTLLQIKESKEHI